MIGIKSEPPYRALVLCNAEIKMKHELVFGLEDNSSFRAIAHGRQVRKIHRGEQVW